MARNGENIYKRKDGRREGRFIREYGLNGKAVYGYVYGRSYTQVRAEKLRRQTAPQKKRAESAPSDVGAAAELWLASVQIGVKRSTCALYRQIMERHVKPELGDLPLESLRTGTLERYAALLLERGRLDGKGGLAPKTVTDILAVVRRVIAYARVLGCPVACEPGKITVRKAAQQMRVLTVEE